MHLRITDVKMNMTLDNHQEADLPNKSQAPPKPHFNQLFSSFTAFTMSAKGKIYKVFHAKQEEDCMSQFCNLLIFDRGYCYEEIHHCPIASQVWHCW